MVHISAATKAAETLLAYALSGWRGVPEGKGGGSPAGSRPASPQRRSPRQQQQHLPAAAPDGVLMRPAQEVANAVTMLPIAILALGVLRDPARSSGAHLVAVSVLVHNPFSLLYHVSCAVNFEKCHPIENNPFLKLDLSFIHIGGMIMSFATSGSLVYFAGSVVFNSICIYRTVTWCGTTFQRRLGRVFCFLNYSAPVALTDAGLFALLLGIFAFIAGTFVFSRQLGGWGHALSHLLLFPFTQCLIWAAGQITAIA